MYVLFNAVDMVDQKRASSTEKQLPSLLVKLQFGPARFLLNTWNVMNIFTAVDCACRVWYLCTFTQLFCKLVSKMQIHAVQSWFTKLCFCSRSQYLQMQAFILQLFTLVIWWHRWTWSSNTALYYLSIIQCCRAWCWLGGIEVCSGYVVLEIFVSYLLVDELRHLPLNKRDWTFESPPNSSSIAAYV
jgi:hypothetical protein